MSQQSRTSDSEREVYRREQAKKRRRLEESEGRGGGEASGRPGPSGNARGTGGERGRMNGGSGNGNGGRSTAPGAGSGNRSAAQGAGNRSRSGAPAEGSRGRSAAPAEGSRGRSAAPAEGSRGRSGAPTEGSRGRSGAPADGSRGRGVAPAEGSRGRNAASPDGRSRNTAQGTDNQGRNAVEGNGSRNMASGNRSRNASQGNGNRNANRNGSGNSNGNRNRNGNGSRNASQGRSGPPMNSGGGGNDKGNRGPRRNKMSRQIGIILCGIQAAITLVFIAALFVLNMLPMKYLSIIIGVLVLLLVVPLASQLISKKKAIAGKVVSVLISIVLVFGSYYIFKTNGTVKAISGGNEKVDKVVVAVLSTDPAKDIQDAAKYDFGVQYAMKGDDIKSTVETINKKLGSDISTKEYKSLNEQAKALHDGKVKAIIYDDAYTSILEEAYPGYSKSVKIIYSHDITKKLENKAAKVEVDNDCFTVYISGIDVYGSIETNSRSDVNIIAVVNPNTHQILLVTTPRDYYVEIPGISGGQKDKLTHAGIYGVDASMATLSKLYDVKLNFYARVNFTSLIQMVDALGGVDVNSEQSFTTSPESGLVMNVQQGMNHFNGKQALAFSRERLNVDGGDFQRGKDQQAVLTAMIKKSISPAILTGANGILNSVSGNVDTNMSQSQIQDLIKSQLADGKAWSIKSMAATGTGDQQECYSAPGSILYVTEPDQSSITAIQKAIDEVEKGETLPDSDVAQ